MGTLKIKYVRIPHSQGEGDQLKLVKVKPLKIIEKGDWIDLYSAIDIHIEGPQAGIQYEKNGKKLRDVTFNNELIPLGIAMELPKGYEAYILPRSSTYRKWKIIKANHQGIIDNSYCGDTDEWKFNAIALGHSTIEFNDKIAQFRISLSQKATFWQKVKWLFTNKIEFIEVKSLENESRGGFGTTGSK